MQLMRYLQALLPSLGLLPFQLLAAEPGKTDQEQVQVVVLAHELNKFEADPFEAPNHFCLGVAAHVGDPSSAQLEALRSGRWPVVPLSSCSKTCSALPPRPENAPLLACAQLTTGDVWFDNSEQANVSVRLIAGPLWGHVGLYKLRRSGQHWEIISYELQAQS